MRRSGSLLCLSASLCLWVFLYLSVSLCLLSIFCGFLWLSMSVCISLCLSVSFYSSLYVWAVLRLICVCPYHSVSFCVCSVLSVLCCLYLSIFVLFSCLSLSLLSLSVSLCVFMFISVAFSVCLCICLISSVGVKWLFQLKECVLGFYFCIFLHWFLSVLVHHFCLWRKWCLFFCIFV